VSTAVGTERRRLAVRLLTPEGAVFDGVAYMVVAPSVQGEVGILPRHTPFIAFLRMGETRIKLLDDTEEVFATTEGYLSVEEDRVLVLVEQAERAADTTPESAGLSIGHGAAVGASWARRPFVRPVPGEPPRRGPGIRRALGEFVRRSRCTGRGWAWGSRPCACWRRTPGGR
jgi:ATP synthase F1 epsilon subunit